MSGIVIATIVVGIIGLLIGIALVFVGKKFAVEVDPKEVAVRECLPGNNCGACGFAGCDAVAAAIAKGEAHVNACPVGGQSMVDKISEIMGMKSLTAVKKVAFVKCAGDCEHTSQKCNYVGIKDCRAAALSGISVWQCDSGCYGYGSCVTACTQDAIHVVNGVAVVDRAKCIGCGQCVKACPKGLIELIREDKKIAVRCANTDKGPAVKKVCSAGCIGCKLCTKQCENEAITVDDNIAHIDYDKCTGCGKCAEKCPVKIIRTLG
ncbi:MAG: RnfABCDGE type electron transport complex subunit B [Clostridiales bacterium]|nr:RnfABCDGE type electron transport complex subunit B [Candidatus Blautia equi]